MKYPSNRSKSIHLYLPGWSADLIIMRNETFDLTGIKVYDDGSDISLIEKTNDQESYSRTNTEAHGVDGNVDPMAVQLQEVAEVQPIEISVLSESHQSEVNLGSHDIDAHGHSNIISHMKELDSSQNAEMNNAGGNIEVSEAENCFVGPGHESSSLTEVVENNLCVPNDFGAPLPDVDKTNDLVDSIYTDMSIPSDQNLNTFPILEEGFVEDKGDKSGAGAIEITEHSVEVRTEVQTDGLEANGLDASLGTGSKETDEIPDNLASFNGELPTEENGNDMLGALNEDQIAASGLGCYDKDTKSGYILGENTEVDGLESVPLVLDEKENYLNDEENPVCQEAGLQGTACPEISAIRSPFVDHNDVSSAICLKNVFSFDISYLLDLAYSY